MEWYRDSFLVSDDPARLDLNALCALLQNTYWAAHRSRETIEISVRHSLNFGVYRQDQLIGFARVITDHATHSYLCDVVLDPEFRGHGLGTWLIECLLDHPALRRTRMDLFTKDAQAFYRKFGFAPHSFDCLVRYPPDYAGGSNAP